MAFDNLTEKLQNVFRNLRSKGRLTEDDVKAALREVKMALLEADVNFRVVKGFVKDVQERAVGQDVMNGLNPGQMVIKIVNEELVKLMGSETTEIRLQPGSAMTVIMMAGLQGAGKTTTTANYKGKNLCLWHATSTVPRRSNSCRSTGRSREWKFFPWAIRTALPILRRLPYSMRQKTGIIL